jgi:hypothetical protein
MGGGSAQVIPPQEKEARATVGVAQTGQTPMDREAWEEAKASVNTGDMASIALVGGGGITPMWDHTHTKEGVASVIGEQDGPTPATTSSRP